MQRIEYEFHRARKFVRCRICLLHVFLGCFAETGDTIEFTDVRVNRHHVVQRYRIAVFEPCNDARILTGVL